MVLIVVWKLQQCRGGTKSTFKGGDKPHLKNYAKKKIKSFFLIELLNVPYQEPIFSETINFHFHWKFIKT